MRALLAALILLVCAVSASAQSVGNGSAPVPYPALQATQPMSALYAPITGTGTTLIKTGSGTFYGVHSFGVQLGITKCFDSVDASGQQIAGGITLGLGGVIQPATSMGIAFNNGLSCTQTISIVGGLLVLYR